MSQFLRADGATFTILGSLFLFARISWELCIPYIAGAVTLIAGIVSVRKEVSMAQGTDRIIACGPMFLGVPMAVFGADHFVFSESVTPMVPSWIPWHLFWVLFVGICLIAGALSLVLRKYAPLAAALFGSMLLLFELLLHIPKIVHTPTDRFAWAVALRDLVFAAGALSFAAVRVPTQWARFARRLPALARFVIGIAAAFFAVEHFLHPEFKPGIPLTQLTPFWFPLRLPLAYLTGMIMLITALGLVLNKGARLAASSLGLLFLLLVLVLYTPIVIATPLAIGSGLNYLVDTLLFGGAVLCFAESQSNATSSRTCVACVPPEVNSKTSCTDVSGR
jgi:uncharacterized membrane protein